MGMFKSASGGYLNGVSGVITSLKWGTKLWPAKVKGKDGATKTANAYTTLSAELLITPDGAEKPVQQFVPAGFFYPDNQSISADGLTLQSDSDGAIIKEDSEFARFVGTAITAGMDLNEDNTQGGRNFDVMVGYRVEFAKVIDTKATAEFGKRPDKTGKLGKDGKPVSYNRDYLSISKVLGAPVAVKGGVKKATNGSGKALPPAAAVDNAAAVAILIGILADADDNVVDSTKVKSLVTKHALEASLDKADREAFTKLISSADFLALEAGWAYDAKAKTVSLA